MGGKVVRLSFQTCRFAGSNMTMIELLFNSLSITGYLARCFGYSFCCPTAEDMNYWSGTNNGSVIRLATVKSLIR